MSFATVHPLNLLFSREAIVSQLNAARAKILFARPRTRRADCSRRSRASSAWFQRSSA
jgi:hypothetical protein